MTDVVTTPSLADHYELLQSRHKKSDRLIIFFIPHCDDIVNGGIVSIFSLAKESRRFKDIHGCEVVIATFPDKMSGLYMTKFPNDEVVYNFAAIAQYFDDLTHLIVHIPEMMVTQFASSFGDEHMAYFKAISSFQINIMNQNINYMPHPNIACSLQAYCDLLTISTSHISYSTKQFQQLFGVPYTRIGTYTDTNTYDRVGYDSKKNVIMLSIDPHPIKGLMVEKMQAALPDFEVISPINIPYDEYKILMRDAKFMITFGEGMDSYFTESVFSGSIAFTICEPRNSIFFSEEQKKPTNSLSQRARSPG